MSVQFAPELFEESASRQVNLQYLSVFTVIVGFCWCLSFIKIMAMASVQRRSNVQAKLQLEVDKMLYVRNLPCDITEKDMYAIFGKYGAIDSIRLGKTPESIGTGFVVYEDMFNAQHAYDCLKGIKVGDQYLVILYYRNKVSTQRFDADRLKKRREKIGKIRPKLILSDD